MPERLAADVAAVRARALASDPGARVLGVVGPPGAGKSTWAHWLVRAVPGAVLVGMDGFHLAHSALEALGRVERKGAPDTFDAAGYVALLQRIRRTDETVWAPEFRREIEDAIAGAVPVPVDTPLVVTEGNYLLLDERPWSAVRGLLDACWYVEVPDEVRHARLQARHRRHGRSPEEAWERTLGSDERNAVLVAGSRHRADALLGEPPAPTPAPSAAATAPPCRSLD